MFFYSSTFLGDDIIISADIGLYKSIKTMFKQSIMKTLKCECPIFLFVQSTIFPSCVKKIYFLNSDGGQVEQEFSWFLPFLFIQYAK